jgi:succinyl-diaminopimelate desuccinylase
MASTKPLDVAEVVQEMENRQDEWIDILSNLIQIPSVNPPGDTTEIADYVMELLDERDIQYEVIAPQEEMPNIAAQFEGDLGEPDDGPHLGFNGHLDTFPVSAEDRWERDPFSGVVEDGKIHGLGSADMHGGFTASLASFFYLFENRDRFQGRVTLTATSDEETGSKWGAEYLLEEYPEYRGDALINGEPSSNGIIRFGGRGAIWMEITVRGESDHSAYPGGLNAIDELYSIIDELRTEVDDFVDIPERERQLILDATESMDAAFGDGATDHVLGLQVNPNVIEGGEKVNLTAERARVELDIRMPIATDGDEIIQRVEELGESSPAEVGVDVFHHTDPTYSDIDDPLLQYLQECAGRVRDEGEPQFSCGLAMTDGRFFRLHDVPTALYGPTPHNVGRQNEFIYVEDFIEIVKSQASTAVMYMREQ